MPRNTSQHLDADCSHFTPYVSILITAHYQECVTMEPASLHPSGVKDRRCGRVMETTGNTPGLHVSSNVQTKCGGDKLAVGGGFSLQVRRWLNSMQEMELWNRTLILILLYYRSGLCIFQKHWLEAPTRRWDWTERKNVAKQRGGVTGQRKDAAPLMRLIWGVGWGLLWKVSSPSTLYGENNDVELIGELILYCMPSRPLE